MVIVGFFSINFTSIGNVTLQLNSNPDMQGRVMALWSVAFLGTTPIGGPVIGWIGENAGARWALLVGGSAAIVAAGIGLVATRERVAVAQTPGPATTMSRKHSPVPVPASSSAGIAIVTELRPSDRDVAP